ncbi:hypothetical protein [Cupriavidus sp. RAF12]|uniref:hypothetical protein n=1 Tax=Cupriavidus sp. RAF12 TaxID=3233050 RepID=UPI003F8F3A93
MSDKIHITQNGERKELFMSFGLLNELCGIVQSPEGVAFIALDAFMRAAILKSVLSERTEDGMIEKEVNLNTLDVPVEDIERVLAWVEDRVMSFFMNALQRLKSVQDKYKGMVPAAPENSTPSSIGTAA